MLADRNIETISAFWGCVSSSKSGVCKVPPARDNAAGSVEVSGR